MAHRCNFWINQQISTFVTKMLFMKSNLSNSSPILKIGELVSRRLVRAALRLGFPVANFKLTKHEIDFSYSLLIVSCWAAYQTLQQILIAND